MKKVLVACMLAASVALGGCATGGAAGGGVVVTPPDITGIVAQIQSYCKIACGFVPTAATIANILSGGNPGVMAATAVSEAICKAISPPMLAGRKAFVATTVKGWHVTPGAVNGVQIEGSRVR